MEIVGVKTLAILDAVGQGETMSERWTVEEINQRQNKIQHMIHSGQADTWMKKSYKITEQLLTDLADCQKARDELVEQVNGLNKLHDFAREDTARECAKIALNSHECEIAGNETGENTFSNGCRAVAKTICEKYGVKV